MTIFPRGALDQLRQHRLGDGVEAAHVDLPNEVKVLNRGFGGDRAPDHAGAVDQDVDPAELGGLAGQALDVLADPHVDRHRGGLGALLGKRLGGLAQRLLEDVGEQQLGPVPGQGARGRRADPAGGAGHHRPSAGEVE